MRTAIWFFVSIFWVFAAFSDVPASVRPRLEVESNPSGAEVVVDGKMLGLTPLVVNDFAAGEHHLRLRLTGYLDHDDFVSSIEGAEIRRSVAMEEELGLLLLKSEPDGCQIRINGVSYGVTPRFIGTLPTRKEHLIRLSKPGYRDQVIAVRFSGREPKVCEAKLMRDSGLVHFASEPAGAEVTVNGIVRGVTPIDVGEIPQGITTVRLHLAGYTDEIRELRLNAGDEQSLSVMMKKLPGSLYLHAEPEFALFYLDGEARGKGPLHISSLDPGTHTLRCEAQGYETLVREVVIIGGEVKREEFRLNNVMGRVELRTVPGGAEVFLDGKKVGVTKVVSSEESEPSELFTIEGVMAGDHTLVVRKNGYRDISRPLDISARETIRIGRLVLKTAFVPDIEITTESGIKLSGVFKRRDGSIIVLEPKPGTEYAIPIRRDTQIRWLGEE